MKKMLIPIVAVKDAHSDCKNADVAVFGGPDNNLKDSESDELSSNNVASDIQTEYNNPTGKKRQFHRRRSVYTVSSIKTTLDKENYEPIAYSHVAMENVAVLVERKGKTELSQSFGLLKNQFKQFEKLPRTLFEISQV